MWQRVERWVVNLIALHSLVVGAALLLVPGWTVRFGGWERAEPLFFLWQAGVFHVIVAAGYLLEYRRHGTVTFLVMTKSTATVFLFGAALLSHQPWVVWFSGLGDGAMGLCAFLAHGFATGARDTRPV